MSTEPVAARRSAAEQVRLDAAITELFEHRITFNQVLGLKVESALPQSPRIRFEMRPELIGHSLYGRLHGGVISSVLDSIGGFALMVAIGERFAQDDSFTVMHRFAKMGTIDLRVDYLRQGIGKFFIATAEVSRLGGRIASTQMRLLNDEGTLIATGAGAYVIA